MFDERRVTRKARKAAQERVVWHGDEDLPSPLLMPAVLAAAAGLVAVWPFTTVIAPGEWSLAVIGVIVTAALSGVITRLFLRHQADGLRDVVTLVVQLLAVTAVVTLIVPGDTGFFGIVPTSDTVAVFGSLAVSTAEEVRQGVAPLAATTGLAVTMSLGFAIIAVLLDQLVWHRAAIMPVLLAGAIGSVPAIITLDDADVFWFIALGVLTLALLRWTARRHQASPRRASAVLAATIGVVAIAATVVAAPNLPLGPGITPGGQGVTVNASLDLGDDLRQPDPVEVLTVATKGSSAPYLRLTTLSRFDGEVWQPDRGDVERQSEGFGVPEWGADIEATEVSTSIRVLRMASEWLPLPYPATDVQGVPAAWRIMLDNRTLVSRYADPEDADYTVTSMKVVPTLEQIRAIDAADTAVDDETIDIPPAISDLAREVTAEATTDYDRLVALQDWFRAEFSYSLDTPVEENFDGTGIDAVLSFLEVRSGYCVHFAGAFALMSESLGMETRIVVGYLPGTPTGEKRGEETVFSVTSDRLHAWPEVSFPGVGWVPFEPTTSLGVPTEFRAAQVEGSQGSDPADPAPTTAPQAEQTTAPDTERPDAGENPTASGERGPSASIPVWLIAGGVLVLLLVPAVIRSIVRAGRRRRAREGDAGAAWTEVRDTLVDLGIPLSDSDTPRMRTYALVRDRDVSPTAGGLLTDAVERATYSRDGSDADGLADALDEVLRALRRSVDRRARMRALLLPRSLFASREGGGVDGLSIARRDPPLSPRPTARDVSTDGSRRV